MKINSAYSNTNQSFTAKLSPLEKEINQEVKKVYDILIKHKKNNISFTKIKNQFNKNELLRDVFIKNDKNMDKNLCAYAESSFNNNTNKFENLSLTLCGKGNAKNFEKFLAFNAENFNTLIHEITHLFQFKKDYAGNSALKYFYEKFGVKRADNYLDILEQYSLNLILGTEKFNSKKFTLKLKKAIRLNHKMTNLDEINALKYYLDSLLAEKYAYKNGFKYQLKFNFKNVPQTINDFFYETLMLFSEKKLEKSFHFKQKEKIIKSEINKRLLSEKNAGI